MKLDHLLEDARQYFVAPAFRIARPAAETDSAFLSALHKDLETILKQLKELPPDDDRNPPRHYADLANGWFQVWNRVIEPGTDRPKEEMRRVFPFLEALRDTLQELGIEVIDHLGKEIPEGLQLEVLGYRTRPGLKRDRVVQTVRPTVYFHDRMIQMGRVYAETGSPDAHPGAT